MTLSTEGGGRRDEPLPRRPWWMFQVWKDLAFLHWPVAPDLLRRLVPPAFELDLLDGSAWIGVVPFRMEGIRPRFLPPVPGLSAFAELNVRTYVRCGGRRGVWFFSLDAASLPAVKTARRFWHLPYEHAAMGCDWRDGAVVYRSARYDAAPGQAEFRARYGPDGPVAEAPLGSPEAFLSDRFRLFAADDEGRVWRAEIDHDPWPLQPCFVDLETDTMTAPLGLERPGPPAFAHFSRRLEVRIWSLEPA